MTTDETPDLRVGVLAARTFKIVNGRFVPPVKSTPDDETWLTATAVAECRRWGYIVLGQPVKHQAPDPDCRCGIYSFTTAQELCMQYPLNSYSVVAVIAPEGMSLEGSLGWRSPKATILAAWIRDDDDRAAIAANYPTVVLYAELSDLLRDYPAIDSGGEIALKLPEQWAQFSVHVPGGRRVNVRFNVLPPKPKPKPEPFWLRPKNPRQRWAR